MAARDTLTAKQEAFAFAVGFENKNYTAAYRENYSTKNMKDRAVWIEASKLANSPKVSLRIDELKELRRKELSRTITWDYKQAESNAKRLLVKNMNDLVRTEVVKEEMSAATNSAIIQSIKLLNEIYEKTLPDKNKEQELRRITAEADLTELKIESLKNSSNETVEEKLDALLGKISGELDD
ncbi:hypothetical protein ACI1T6_06935 [Lactococcus petauri]|uniref:hypothetical protein n=1 Tax=Lactococcus petauri TaxID=1940789 RepID=UPI0038526E10